MRKYSIALLLTIIVLAATGCGDESDGASPSPVTQVAGKTYSDGTSYGLTYSCGDDLSQIDIPNGESVNVNGSSFSLTTAPESNTVSVLEISLSENDSLPAIIITGPDHLNRPSLYNQTVLKVGLSGGGTGSYKLDSQFYSQNYKHQPIPLVTLCIKTTSSE